jgi:hypothetical protein
MLGGLKEATTTTIVVDDSAVSTNSPTSYNVYQPVMH